MGVEIVASRPVAMEPSGPRLLWDALRGATGYDVARGDLELLRASGGDFDASSPGCVASNLTSLSIPAPAKLPAAWYLVRPTNCGGKGTWDAEGASQVAPRGPSLSSCP